MPVVERHCVMLEVREGPPVLVAALLGVPGAVTMPLRVTEALAVTLTLPVSLRCRDAVLAEEGDTVEVLVARRAEGEVLGEEVRDSSELDE